MCFESSAGERTDKGKLPSLHSAVVSGGNGMLQACTTTTLITVWSKNAVLWFGLPTGAFPLESVQYFHSLCWCRSHFGHHLNSPSCLWEARWSLLPASFAISYTDFANRIQIYFWSIARALDFEGWHPGKSSGEKKHHHPLSLLPGCWLHLPAGLCCHTRCPPASPWRVLAAAAVLASSPPQAPPRLAAPLLFPWEASGLVFSEICWMYTAFHSHRFLVKFWLTTHLELVYCQRSPGIVLNNVLKIKEKKSLLPAICHIEHDKDLLIE